MVQFKDILFVGLGSCLGGMLRYVVSLAMRTPSGAFPWGTLTVNLLGSLLLGILWGAFSRIPGTSPALNLFLTVGFCGGFTTFSTFSKESVALLQAGSIGLFFIYVGTSVILGLIAAAFGFIAAR